MSLRQVFAVCPHAVVLPPDWDHYEATQNALLDALEDLAPVVESGEQLGSAYLDLTGMEQLYPDVAVLLRKLAHAASSTATAGQDAQLDVRIGVGSTKFVADVAARRATRAHPVVVPPGRAQRFVASLPLHHLPVNPEMRRRLELFGLGSLGQVATMSAAAMEAQFGREGRRAWELARGIDNDPVVPRRPFRPIAESLAFPAPIADWSALWAGIRQLLAQAWRRKERGSATVRQLQFVVHTGEEDWERTITFHQPVGELGLLEGMVRRQLIGSALPGAVHAATVKLTALGGAYVRQGTLFVGNSDRLDRIREALAKLKARHGMTGLYRLAEVEPWSRIPERRHALISFDP